MTETELNKAIVRRFNFEILEQGKVDLFPDLVDRTFVNRTALPGTGGSYEALLNVVVLVLRPAFPDLTVEIHDQIAEGDLVVTRKTLQGTHQRSFMGIPPSGTKVRMPTIDIVRLRNGKYVEHWAVRDMSEVHHASKLAKIS